jgi:hypothetical protein
MSAPARDPHDRLPIGSLDGLEKFAPLRAKLDLGIRHFVLILRSQGVDTVQSCQGGPGHSFLEPTIEFNGGAGEGLRAVAAAQAYGLPLAALFRVWTMQGHKLVGPIWAMIFSVRADVWLKREAAHAAAYFKKKKSGRDAT